MYVRAAEPQIDVRNPARHDEENQHACRHEREEKRHEHPTCKLTT